MDRRKFLATSATIGIFGYSTIQQNSYGISSIDRDKSGEEMFKGIFFFQGDYAKSLIRNRAYGTISNSQREEILASANSPEAISASTAIISQLRREDNNIFSSLHDSIYTGDPYKVFHQLNIIIDKIFNTEYIQNRLKNSSFQNNGLASLPSGSTEPTCWVAAVVAAGVAIVVAAVAVFNAVAGVNWALGANVGAAYNVAYAATLVKNRDRLSSVSTQYSFSHTAVSAIIKTMNVR